MNWKAIKHIYINILVHQSTIQYLGDDKYKITGWHKNGNKHWEGEYQNGQLHGKYIGWRENGSRHWKMEYQNGKQIK